MKKFRTISMIFITAIFSLFMINSCEVFNPTYEEFELYGTWNIDELSIDIDISGDNSLEVIAARAVVAAFKNKLEDEMNEEIDSLGGSISFYDDGNYILAMMEESDTGTYYFNQEESSIALSAEEAFIDELNIEKLNDERLIISWTPDLDEFESDSTDETLIVELTIEAVFFKDE